MDIGEPLGSIFPGAHGVVLSVLARTFAPLSGRQVAALADGRVSVSRAARVLSDLSAAGIVLREERPPAKLYQLNRAHVAAPAIAQLTALWPAVLDNIRREMADWNIQPMAACLFGSAARGQAGSGSDIDILVITDDIGSDAADRGGSAWEAQLTALSDHVLAWSGNACEVLELTASELRDAVARDDRLVRDLRSDAIALSGRPIKELVSHSKARA